MRGEASTIEVDRVEAEEFVARGLDAFAAVLRHWGASSGEADEIWTPADAEEYEAWARHLLLATGAPGARCGGAEVRDWRTLVERAGALRRGEYDRVEASLSDLRQMVWFCLESFGRASRADRAADGKLAGSLRHLGAEAGGLDLDALRQEVVATVHLAEEQIEQRATRHREQIDELSGRLRSVRAALHSQRRAGELDALTQVCGRSGMDAQLAQLCRVAAVFQPAVFGMLIDIDHFKWVNDRFGHGVGDEVLRRVAARLRREFHEPGDFVARYGGDEFLVTIEETNVAEAVRRAERTLFSIREIELERDGDPVRVSASIGVASLEMGQSAQEWVDRADQALYAAKDAGRDRLSVAPGG